MSACVFCGALADSKEHVFAKRLFRRAGADRLRMLPGLYNESTGTRTRPSHFLDTFEVRCFCATCNNGWMNDLEAWFESRLGSLIEPDWPKLAITMIDDLKREGHQLALWLLKTAITFNQACMKGTLHVQFPEKIARSVKAGQRPDNCWVDLAYAKIPTVGAAMDKCFRVINGGKHYPSQVPPGVDGFRFTVQFNHLLLHLARAPFASVTYESWNGESPVRLYPKPASTPPTSFAYEDIMKFHHAVVLETWLGCQGNVGRDENAAQAILFPCPQGANDSFKQKQIDGLNL